MPNSLTPEKKPWYKNPWLLGGAATGALGGGFLIDQLVNHGGVTNGLLNALKPKIPSPDAATTDQLNNLKEQAIRSFPNRSVLESTLGTMDVPQTTTPVGNAANATVLAGVGKAVGEKTFPSLAEKLKGLAPSFSSAAGGVLNKVLPPAAVVQGYEIAANNPELQQAMASSYGVSPDTAKRMAGLANGGVEGLSMLLGPAGMVAGPIAANATTMALNKGLQDVSEENAQNEFLANLAKTQTDYLHNNNTAGLKALRDLFPRASTQNTFLNNMPRLQQQLKDFYSKL